MSGTTCGRSAGERSSPLQSLNFNSGMIHRQWERNYHPAVPVRREPEPGRIWAEVPGGDRLDELLFRQKPARGRDGHLPQRRKRRELHGDPGGEVRLRPLWSGS